MVWCIPDLRRQQQQDLGLSPSPCRSPAAVRSVLSPKALNDCRAIERANAELCKRMQSLCKPASSPATRPGRPRPAKSPCSPARQGLRRVAVANTAAKALAMPEQAVWARETAGFDYEDLSEEVGAGCFGGELAGQLELARQLVAAGAYVGDHTLQAEWAQATSRVLQCAAVHCSRQGEAFVMGQSAVEVAAVLLLLFQHDESKAFWTLIYMNSTVFEAYWHGPGLSADIAAIDQMLADVSPELSEHLAAHQLTPGQLAREHLTNAFATAAGLRVLKQLWAMVLDHGRHALVAGSVAVLVWAVPELLELNSGSALQERFSDAVSVCLQPAELREATGIWMEALPRQEYNQIVANFLRAENQGSPPPIFGQPSQPAPEQQEDDGGEDLLISMEERSQIFKESESDIMSFISSLEQVTADPTDPFEL